jgi:hypothetical protein
LEFLCHVQGHFGGISSRSHRILVIKNGFAIMIQRYFYPFGRGLSSLAGTFPGTITPWLIGGLILLVLITASITIRSWRESKRSPYFFLRVQATKKMQSYAVATFGLLIATLATTAYAWQSPADTTPRVAILTRAKPALVERVASPEAEVAIDASPAALDITLSPASVEIAPLEASAAATDPLRRSELPEEYNQFTPTVELSENTVLGDIFFSTDITSNYEAINPGRRFTEGFYTIYATFSYDGMADGMVWSWVWRHNGEVIDGGNQMWKYGPDGPGYVYIRPETGFFLGEYALEVWVNGELFTASSFTITEGTSAAN